MVEPLRLSSDTMLISLLFFLTLVPVTDIMLKIKLKIKLYLLKCFLKLIFSRKNVRFDDKISHFYVCELNAPLFCYKIDI